jgi:hypothetical protein
MRSILERTSRLGNDEASGAMRERKVSGGEKGTLDPQDLDYRDIRLPQTKN